MSKIEVYKELGAYERHFNQMQSIYRSLASTWLLATFGAIEYIFNKDFTARVIDARLGGSLIALAGGTGIFLLWLIDVMVYHKLLVAVTKESEILEQDQELPKLRQAMAREVVSHLGRIRLSARRKISLFYGLPTLFLFSIAFMLQFDATSAEGPAIAVAVWLWHVLLATFIVVILIANRPTE